MSATDGGAPVPCVVIADGQLHDTNDLVADPELRVRVDALANAPNISGRLIGPTTSASYPWIEFKSVTDLASRCDVLALLSHRSPIVRGYLARHVAENFPDDDEKLLPLLHDAAQLKTISGCFSKEETVSAVAAEALRRKAPGNLQVQSLLANAARDPMIDVAIRTDLLEHIAFFHNPESRAIALQFVADASPELRASGLRALEKVGTGADVPTIAGFAAATDASSRIATARALGGISSPRALTILKLMLTDADPEVRSAAAHGYAQQPSGDVEVLKSLLANPKVNAETEKGLAARGDLEAIALLRPILLHGDASGYLALDLDPENKPERIPLFRDLLDADHVEVRRWALYFLGKEHDLPSGTRIRRALRSHDANERGSAAMALGMLPDHDSIPDLMSLLSHPDFADGSYVLDALVALHATEAIPALEAKVAHHDSFDILNYQRALAALRGDAGMTP